MFPFEGRVRFSMLLGSLLTNNQIIPGTFEFGLYRLSYTLSNVL